MDEPFWDFSLGFLFGIRVCVFYDQSVLHGQLLDLQWNAFKATRDNDPKDNGAEFFYNAPCSYGAGANGVSLLM